MRSFRRKGSIAMKNMTFAALALASFIGAMTVEITDANAVVCARGVHRAGCVGPSGRAVVVHRRPAVRCRWVWVHGRRVRRCW
jgi:hypothetical protein